MAANRGGFTVRINDALNALTYLIGVVSFISVFRYINPVISAAFLGLLTLAAWFDYKKRIKISRIVLNLVIVVLVLLNSLIISMDNIAAPLVEILLILMGIKFIEEKKPRDYMQIYTLSVFLLTGSALLSLDIQFVAILLVLACLLPVGSVLLTFYSQDGRLIFTRKDLFTIVTRALLLTAMSIPLASLLFVILPRTGFPLLNFMSRAGTSAGFTDNVRLGEVSSIQENASVIIRAVTPRLDNEALYWRGIALDYFDGISWKSSGQTGQHKESMTLKGRRVMQTIYLEPYGNRYLFALDKPVTFNYRFSTINADHEIVSSRNIDSRIKYDVVSVLSDYIGIEKIDRARYLQLPLMDFSRILEILKQIGINSSDEKTAEAIMRFLKYGTYSYSLNNLPFTREPIDDFLFKYKYGNCEYFASAMAVMLRISGIPSRIIGGYTGGSYNDFGGYYSVTQDHAHVWVEVFIAGRGWLRMDPTPGSAGFPSPTQTGLLHKIRMMFDGINYYWNAMVIGYDFNKQITLFTNVGAAIKYQALNPAALKKSVLIGLSVVLAVIITLTGLYRISKIKPSVKRIISDFEDLMKIRGYQRMPNEGLEEFTSRISDKSLREKASRFVTEFHGLYYRDRKIGLEEIARLKRMLCDLRDINIED
jgi:hypothetical protein